jgi:ankyrin repeat protein
MHLSGRLLFLMVLANIPNIMGMEEPATKRQRMLSEESKESLDLQLKEAVLQGNYAEIKQLIEAGAHVNAAYNYSEAVNHILCDYQVTPLHLSARRRHKEIVSLLLECGADVHAHNGKGEEPLFVAAMNGDIAIAKLLLDKGAYVSANDRYDATPLHIAINNTEEKMARFLISKGASVNGPYGYSVTPLHLAIRNNLRALAKFLIAMGAHLNAVDHTGRTPLYHAVSSNANLEMVEFLIKQGADVRKEVISEGAYYPKNIDIKRPLCIASKSGLSIFGEGIAIVKTLLKGGAALNVQADSEVILATEIFGNQPLILAVVLDDLEQVKRLLNEEIAASELNEALLYGAAQGHKDIVLTLLGQGKPDALEALKVVNHILATTSLTPYARMQYTAIKEQLLRRLSLKRYIVNKPELCEAIGIKGGITKLPVDLGVFINPSWVLFDSIAHGNIDGVSQALRAGANSNAIDLSGSSALACAALYKGIEQSKSIVELLLKHGAIPSNALLHILCIAQDREERKEIIHMLFIVAQDLLVTLDEQVMDWCK